MVKHVICYSGGHSSALVAIEVCRKFGKENVILLNHDIHQHVEDMDIKRFKNEVAKYLELEVTYANNDKWETLTPIKWAIKDKAFHINHNALCTSRLKTKPFMKWIKENISESKKDEFVFYYGFDKNEIARVQRRSSVMGSLGLRTDYPLALWSVLTIESTRDIGIEPPLSYSTFKHANCTGCLKAGRQHWYVVHQTRQDIYKEAEEAEEILDDTIIKDISLNELRPLYEKMAKAGILATEHIGATRFWLDVKKKLKEIEITEQDIKPCECST